jgi:hypothetical protein
MPIIPYLDDMRFDPETRRVMGVAFEMVSAALRIDGRIDDTTDHLGAIIARKVIEFAQAGERDPDWLCEKVLIDLRAAFGSVLATASTSSRSAPRRRTGI